MASFESLFRVGTPGLRVQARIDIERGCRFIQAAKAGLIDEPHPIKTIAGWFGVTQRTVLGWNKTMGATDLLIAFCPDAGNRGVLIASEAIKAGGRYSVGGRGRKAVETRDRKRKRSAK